MFNLCFILCFYSSLVLSCHLKCNLPLHTIMLSSETVCPFLILRVFLDLRANPLQWPDFRKKIFVSFPIQRKFVLDVQGQFDCFQLSVNVINLKIRRKIGSSYQDIESFHHLKQLKKHVIITHHQMCK